MFNQDDKKFYIILFDNFQMMKLISFIIFDKIKFLRVRKFQVIQL